VLCLLFSLSAIRVRRHIRLHQSGGRSVATSAAIGFSFCEIAKEIPIGFSFREVGPGPQRRSGSTWALRTRREVPAAKWPGRRLGVDHECAAAERRKERPRSQRFRERLVPQATAVEGGPQIIPLLREAAKSQWKPRTARSLRRSRRWSRRGRSADAIPTQQINRLAHGWARSRVIFMKARAGPAGRGSGGPRTRDAGGRRPSRMNESGGEDFGSEVWMWMSAGPTNGTSG
jgi:hypothetical protein